MAATVEVLNWVLGMVSLVLIVWIIITFFQLLGVGFNAVAGGGHDAVGAGGTVVTPRAGGGRRGRRRLNPRDRTRLNHLQRMRRKIDEAVANLNQGPILFSLKGGYVRYLGNPRHLLNVPDIRSWEHIETIISRAVNFTTVMKRFFDDARHHSAALKNVGQRRMLDHLWELSEHIDSELIKAERLARTAKNHRHRNNRANERTCQGRLVRILSNERNNLRTLETERLRLVDQIDHEIQRLRR